jgi:hypothetical protein
MRAAGNHPENLFVLIDGEMADKSYVELQQHVESCPECKEEIRLLKSVDGMFRSREFELDTPPFQWERIRARLKEPQPAVAWWERFYEVFNPRPLAWRFALGILLAVVLSLSGFEYHRHIVRNQFNGLVTFSESERQRIASAENPFHDILAVENENPFLRMQIPDDRSNPFAVR